MEIIKFHSSSSPCLFLIIILIFHFSYSATSTASGHGGIAAYWGQNVREGRLTYACATRKFQIINIAFLSTFGSGQRPQVNLTRHCNPISHGCRNVSVGVNNCHNDGVKVMLSIGGPHGNYSLSSSGEAVALADYIWNNFLGGRTPGSRRPFGDATLDGVDFRIEKGPFSKYYELLARRLYEYGRRGGRKVYLTAAPSCRFPDRYLSGSLKTRVFDYVWVRFFNNAECQYDSRNPSRFWFSWMRWVSMIPARKFYVGLPASEEAGDGYVPPELLIRKVVPFVKRSYNYGGVMLFDLSNDVQTNYSTIIRGKI